MRLAETLSSSATGLFVAREAVPGTIPENADWNEREPNEYGDFGPELNKVSRNPINANRRRKKGTVVGQSVSAGYMTDITATNMIEDAQAFLMSDARFKSNLPGLAVLADGVTVAEGGLAFKAGVLVAIDGSTVPANNGLRIVTADSADNKVTLAGLTPSADPVQIARCGVQFPAGAASIDTDGGFPALVVAGFDFAAHGIGPGELCYMGGDGSVQNFDAPANRGYVRVYAVEAGRLTFDKTDAPFVEDAGAGKTIRLFYGHTVRDEDAALQVIRSYSIRRRLGSPDLDAPQIKQSEVCTRSIANELTISIPEEDKITAELSFLCGDYITFKDDAVIGGQFTSVIEEDAINSTTDSVRASMIVYDGTSAPLPVFAVFQEMEFTINNNLSENKAITRFGAFNITPGAFEVDGSFTGYFVGLEATQAVRDNADVSFMFATWKENKGWAMDFPMLSLATSGLSVEQNEPITIEIDGEAASGKKYHPDMDHTVLMVFFPYLPNNARN